MSQGRLTWLLNQGWLYRDEGNANIAISIPSRREIIRLPKTGVAKSLNHEFDSMHMHFYIFTMIRLLGDSYAMSSRYIQTFKEEIQRLNRELSNLRPEFRKHKAIEYGWATIWVDYAFLPKELNMNSQNVVFAVELKPKQGWCPMKERLHGKCQFCRNQYLKLQNKQITGISSYCPMDLFSGRTAQMVKALQSLINAPQNNFKVFRNGVYAYGENTSFEIFENIVSEIFEAKYSSTLRDNFCDLIQNALVKEFLKETCKECNEFEVPDQQHKLDDLQCAFDYSNLPKGCVLNRILQLQKLNLYGTEKNYEFYKTLVEKKPNMSILEYLNDASDLIAYSPCSKCAFMRLTRGFYEHEPIYLFPYLVASVLCDCSLMVTFRKVNGSESVSDKHLIKTSNSAFLVSVKIMDLFLKDFTILEKHAKRNVEVENAYTSCKD